MKIFVEMILFLTVLAIVTEFLTDRIKGVLPWRDLGPVQLVPLYALIIGQVVAFLAGIGLLESLGFVIVYRTLDVVLTGLAISGGAEVWHELTSKLRELRGGEQ